MNALQAIDLHKSFTIGERSIEVLRGLSIELPEGAFHAVMGPSGSGKSTLLNLLAGLLTPDKGMVTVAGQSLSDASDNARTLLRRKTMGIIFQDYNLIPTLTVAENIALPSLLEGKALPKEQVDHLLEQVGLTHRRDQIADHLSGGEAQRTAIARAFAHAPSVILADEPTGNLDSPAAQRFCETLVKLNKEFKTAILIISHDPQVASAADCVHFLKDGKIVAHAHDLHDPAALALAYTKAMA